MIKRGLLMWRGLVRQLYDDGDIEVDGRDCISGVEFIGVIKGEIVPAHLRPRLRPLAVLVIKARYTRGGFLRKRTMRVVERVSTGSQRKRARIRKRAFIREIEQLLGPLTDVVGAPEEGK